MEIKALQRHLGPSETPFLFSSVLMRKMPDQVGHDSSDMLGMAGICFGNLRGKMHVLIVKRLSDYAYRLKSIMTQE